MQSPKISVIIPTLNEEKYLRKTIDNVFLSAQNPNCLEVLVVDAGSTDHTLQTIEEMNVQTFLKPEFALKKYESLNYGMAQAKADVLIFLDADSILPKGFDEMILDKLSSRGTVGGAFDLVFDLSDWRLSVILALNRIRYRLGHLFYGDQAVFCRKTVAEAIGGFPEKELMESAFFCKKLKSKGRLKLIRKPIETSARRFNENGFFKVFWFDVTMWIRFVLNLPLDTYGKKYWGWNLKPNG
ncbi:MAG: glycosyltransferase family 2 protein [Cyclobacteriaceae bacterium]